MDSAAAGPAASPAANYAAARRRGARPGLADFVGGYPFALDPFQREACEALEDGLGVLVAAPTGAGKTVVGEFAVHLALRTGTKCFYTTPIKALSNQKYADLVNRYGAADVGLLTGDNAINGDAPVVVMTTEVLRNMLYVSSAGLTGLSYVVMDEVHYLADRFRGPTWEEVIIHLPAEVSLVSLSATVSNAEEFGRWLVTVRGDTRVVVSEERPVPLWQHMLLGRRMFDLFAEDGSGETEPSLVRAVRDQRNRRSGQPSTRRGRGTRTSRPPRHLGPSRPEVLEQLDRAGLLPAITFVFSRAGCDAAVAQCRRSGLTLTSAADRAEIREVVDRRTAAIADEDLQVLGYWDWLEGLERGLAAHHAGMLPTFKETVEELFVRGLVRAVFATETLALGINMPARSVVLDRLDKWNGQAHADITPGEYTQLTGRAGRRGIDVEGHAVVVWSPDVEPTHVAGLASTRLYPLRSSFRPTYNMAVNLVRQMGRNDARDLLGQSFAQFQADAGAAGLAAQVRRNSEAMTGYADAMHCELGDFAAYAELRERIGTRESTLAKAGSAARRAEAAAALGQLRSGDVIRVPSGRRAGVAVVVDPGTEGLGEPRPLVVTEDRWAGRLSAADFTTAVEALTRVRVPRHFDHRSPQARRDLASTLRAATLPPGQTRRRGRAAAADDGELVDLRASMRAHPCHACPEREEHARWAERYHRLRRDTAALEQRVRSRTGSLARTFDRVCSVLDGRGYLNGDEVTPAGEQLARIWSETDLLVAECLRVGVWAGLSAPELAAAVSPLVFETRRPDEVLARVPGGPVAQAVGVLGGLYAELADDERAAGLDRTREPDPGFAWPAYRWVRGEPLGTVLDSGSGPDPMPAGDFVRWIRQLLDVLEQIAAVSGADPVLRRTAREAAATARRGIVGYSAVS